MAYTISIVNDVINLKVSHTENVVELTVVEEAPISIAISDKVGPQGPPGPTGGITSIVAGANITVDNSDPANPVVSSSGGSGGSGPLPTIDKTYEQLLAMQVAGTLVAGQTYRITDYRTKHRVWGTSVTPVYHVGSVEPLIVTANSSDSLERLVYSDTYPQDIIHYELVDSSAGLDVLMETQGARCDWECDRGRILFRHDTLNDVQVHCDFREYRVYVAKTAVDLPYFDMFPQDDWLTEGVDYFEKTLVPMFPTLSYNTHRGYACIDIKPLFTGGMQRIAFLSEQDTFWNSRKILLDVGSENHLYNGRVGDINTDTCTGVIAAYDINDCRFGSGTTNRFHGTAMFSQFNASNTFRGNVEGVFIAPNVECEFLGNLLNCQVMTGYTGTDGTRVLSGDHTGELIGYPVPTVTITPEIPAIGYLIRSTRGLVLQDTFEDNDISDWTLASGTATVATGKVTNIGTITKAISCASPAMLKFDLQNIDASNAYNFGADLRYGANKFEVLAYNVPALWIVYDGVTITPSSVGYNNNTACVIELHIYLDRIAGFIDGVEMVSYAMDTTGTSIDTLALIADGCGSGIIFDNVLVMDGCDIRCTNMPDNYYLSVGGRVSKEVNGTAIVPANGLSFPLSSVEILDSNGYVVKAFDAPNDIWAGDIYVY